MISEVVRQGNSLEKSDLRHKTVICYYQAEYEQAVWMYGYTLTFDETFLAAKSCVQTAACLMLFGENYKKNIKDN